MTFNCSLGGSIFADGTVMRRGKTKFAIRKYKDLKNTSNDKKSTLATQQVTVPKTIANTHSKNKF